ncbi:MAG: alpha/beta hydrolase [Coriobacteriia bacterium]|nr:alpha/beta hydrolase [Coriobacteriia bacterium]
MLALVLLVLVGMPLYAASLLLHQRYDVQQRDSLEFGIESQYITLTTSDDLNLAAWRTFAETEGGSPYGTVIILSGIQRPSVTEFFGYADMLAQEGWDALLIEKRARGSSEGTTIGLGFTEWKDVQAGVEFLDADQRAGDFPIVAMGTSAGGATVLTAGGNVPRIDGVISISGYSTWTEAYVDNAVEVGIPRFVAVASSPFMDLIVGARFGFDVTGNTPAHALEYFGTRPLLLMHSTEDHHVPITHFNRLQKEARAFNIPLSTFVREGDWHFVVYDHYIEDPVQDDEFSQSILGFLNQFEEGSNGQD